LKTPFRDELRQEAAALGLDAGDRGEVVEVEPAFPLVAGEWVAVGCACLLLPFRLAVNF